MRILGSSNLVFDLIIGLSSKDIDNLSRPQMVVKMVLKNTHLLF